MRQTGTPHCVKQSQQHPDIFIFWIILLIIPITSFVEAVLLLDFEAMNPSDCDAF